MTSDVIAWRYAWKLWRATRKELETNGAEALYNIVVVDDRARPVRFYDTGEPEIFNPRNLDGKIEIEAGKEDERDWRKK